MRRGGQGQRAGNGSHVGRCEVCHKTLHGARRDVLSHVGEDDDLAMSHRDGMVQGDGFSLPLPHRLHLEPVVA